MNQQFYRGTPTVNAKILTTENTEFTEKKNH